MPSKSSVPLWILFAVLRPRWSQKPASQFVALSHGGHYTHTPQHHTHTTTPHTHTHTPHHTTPHHTTPHHTPHTNTPRKKKKFLRFTDRRLACMKNGRQKPTISDAYSEDYSAQPCLFLTYLYTIQRRVTSPNSNEPDPRSATDYERTRTRTRRFYFTRIVV